MSAAGNLLDLNTETKKSSSPWGKIAQPIAVSSLEEVMSEQLADDLQQKENNNHTTSGFINENSKLSEPKVAELDQIKSQLPPDVDNDFLLAQLLQLEFDKEYDEVLKQHENHKNRNSRVHPKIDQDESDINHKNKPDLVETEESEDELEKITFKRGVHGKGEKMISKHDLLLASRHNASKVMMFPPEFETGDSHGIDMRLSNKVFNVLKLHSHHEEKRHNRLHDKSDKSTQEISLDPKTRLILFKLVNADILDSMGGVISTGKEATIFYASGGKTQEQLVPKECVAKVFKTTLNEFKTRDKYINDDYRFKDRYKHLNPQKIVKLWAEKEMHNLMKMRKFGIPCPDVVILKKHVLIMSFLGKDSVPAPKLKDANLNEKDLRTAYEQSIQLVKDLYHRCNLVHADFNQFNLLWFEDRVWVLDVSQSVEPIHPMGLEFLLRDCDNIHKFFTNRKLDDVKTAEEIFNEVTGMNFKGQGELFLSQIQKYIKDKQMELNASKTDDSSKNEYNFDYYFEKSVKSKLKEQGGDDSDSDEDDLSEDDEE